jgi:hypothetical protein
MSPDPVADAIVTGIDRRTFWITPGAEATALAWTASLLWRLLQRVFDRRAARARSTV